MISQNLHTHTTYCDGNNTCREIVEEAIKKGFKSIGFSGHGHTSFDLSFCMNKENTEKYNREIDNLKTLYKGRIDIFKGIEYDLCSDDDPAKYDYVIGSVHYMKIGDTYYSIDMSRETTEDIIKNHFGGEWLKYTKAYFEDVCRLTSLPTCHIIGHFDCVSKFSEHMEYFDTNNEIYLKQGYEAIEVLAEKYKVFEVNTGAISRGYKSAPYPSVPFLKKMKQLGMLPVITSDCHSKEDLDYKFTEMSELLKSIGYKEILYFNGAGFNEEKI